MGESHHWLTNHPRPYDRITQWTDAINGPTALTYDANSNLLTVTDAKSQQTVYTYSNMNRTATRKGPSLRTKTYTYDNNGNVATVTDRKAQVTTYTYDPLNRRTKATSRMGRRCPVRLSGRGFGFDMPVMFPSNESVSPR